METVDVNSPQLYMSALFGVLNKPIYTDDFLFEDVDGTALISTTYCY